MTSNRQRFIKLIKIGNSCVEYCSCEYCETVRDELIRLYDLNHRELDKEEINRLATADKCPYCLEKKKLKDITARDLLGIKNERCPNCNKIITKAKEMANGLIFCDFDCMVAYNNKKEKGREE